ncbi:MAG: thiamine-phosphate kinase [Actinobacteria bacterium]|nr:thiamine-phosphate kinase [Actinomycetota bacterium]
MGFSEAEVIAVLQEVFATPDPRIIVGIGDDAAVVTGSSQQVISTDMAVEGVHFKREWSSAFDIGRRITAANIADVLAMGARCDYLVAAVSLTGSEELSWIENLARGMKAEADKANAVIVGGDIARAPSITIAMTAIGSTSHPILRSGAQIGDGIFLSSLPGWSAAGLHLLTHELATTSEMSKKAISEFRAPTLDYEIDFSSATSLSDISDSLIVQVTQMAAASGSSFALDTELISRAPEFSELNSLAQEVNIDVWNWILGGGEDHVFLATGANLPGLRIGKIIEGSGISGLEMKKAPVSWSHFT